MESGTRKRVSIPRKSDAEHSRLNKDIECSRSIEKSGPELICSSGQPFGHYAKM